jgi:hypothetical protein
LWVRRAPKSVREARKLYRCGTGPFPLAAWICLLIVYVVWVGYLIVIGGGVLVVGAVVLVVRRSPPAH